MKILLFTCRQSGQRINYYNELGNLADLTVICERETPQDVLNNFNISLRSYKEIILKGVKMFEYMGFCPSILKYAFFKEYDIFIIEQYSTPSSLFLIPLMALFGKKFVLNSDGGVTHHNENVIKKNIKKFFISKASLYLTSGNNGVKFLTEYGAKKDKIKLFPFSPYQKKDLPNQIMSYEQKKAFRSNDTKLDISEAIVLFSVGQQIPRKGFDILCKAMIMVDKSVGVYIAGGDPGEEVKKIIDEYNLDNIHFIGFKNKEELKKYYSLADIFVFPTRQDIWGYPINEAMAFGLPIISSDACGAALDIVEENVNGMIFRTEDIENLTHCINKLVKDRKLMNNMSNNNIEKRYNYTSEKMAEAIVDILQDALPLK